MAIYREIYMLEKRVGVASLGTILLTVLCAAILAWNGFSWTAKILCVVLIVAASITFTRATGDTLLLYYSPCLAFILFAPPPETKVRGGEGQGLDAEGKAGG